jgi:hypothetical protein
VSIHVTPEDHCSFLSFETSVGADADVDAFVARVAETFMLRRQGDDERARLTKGGRLDLYVIEPFAGHAPPAIFSACNPGAVTQIENVLTENPKQTEHKWHNFSQRLDSTLSKAMQGPSQKSSPVLQTINAAAAESFGNLDKAILERRLVLITDFIQFGDGINFYKSIPTFNDFSRTSFYVGNKPNLRGVQVRIGLLVNQSETRPYLESLKDLWLAIIDDAQGIIDSYAPITG